MWLEMSRNEEHGGAGWFFSECLWAPSHRKGQGGNWAFWELLLGVRKGDIVLHLRGKTHQAAFVGYSIADANGYETKERPPSPGLWSYANSFYRVPLTDFVPFATPIKLDDVFSQCEKRLRDYFFANKVVRNRKKLFYVVQSGRLQCLNGAYLSEFDIDLANIVLGPDFSQTCSPRSSRISARTGEQIAQIRARIGQNVFSENVRANYDHRCCFPGCVVAEREFLIGAHIARWADAPDFRGQVSNGLCLCLFHDRAFELGFFTLTAEGRVWLNTSKLLNSQWAQAHLLPYHGETIRFGKVYPSPKALHYHWQRINCFPEESL